MPAWMQRLVRGYASRARLAEVAWEDMSTRRAWIDAFRARPLGPTDVQLQFMRSAGHGGQNVNKVNTKVRAKFILGEHALPAALAQALATGSPLYTPSTHALQVASDRFRSQRQNVEDALQKD
ncbi:hypothetical protein MVES_003515 [Malassezia vespertilionis]|uniref:Prokaryotic-type class I peptide chain release factors domain-containing protein n=1 Tax=Malassezia vespertilionis TaxID=2020962 RepID=A0A2N1J856_9BASI|nr:hypothetical protein MVES_003515 [Malassezia vespertilionis]